MNDRRACCRNSRRWSSGGLSTGRHPTPAGALSPSPALDRRLRAARFDRIPLPDLPPPPSQADRRVAPADFRTPPEHVYVVAFLVRRVARCPDPKPGLLW
ncbi:hypothetical protein GCM10020367_69780 [Streptomyces sannanensis]|uniref:Uncharacterized protein n=1 Tax=Streptomyces sannanensis TaxID=285536 RepID=A0ABP6SNU1_9ACTN